MMSMLADNGVSQIVAAYGSVVVSERFCDLRLKDYLD